MKKMKEIAISDEFSLIKNPISNAKEEHNKYSERTENKWIQIFDCFEDFDDNIWDT